MWDCFDAVEGWRDWCTKELGRIPDSPTPVSMELTVPQELAACLAKNGNGLEGAKSHTSDFQKAEANQRNHS